MCCTAAAWSSMPRVRTSRHLVSRTSLQELNAKVKQRYLKNIVARTMVRLSPLASLATWRGEGTSRPPLPQTGGPREGLEHDGTGVGGGTSRLSRLTFSIMVESWGPGLLLRESIRPPLHPGSLLGRRRRRRHRHR
jgi:hypothetical protein